MTAMKNADLIAQLQELPADADVFLGWYETNESGTAWETGKKASYVERAPGVGKKPDHIVIW
jgi:hypothetical protein